MAFTFPNPNTTTEFTADNGITYSWDPIDGKWVVKGFAIDNAELDDTYLRLDCDNSPLVSSSGLEIKTNVDNGSGFGAASLTLNGKRDNKNYSAATINFKNWNFDDSDTVNGYLTYQTVATGGYFRFNKDVNLNSGDTANPASLNFASGGQIQHNGGKRITFKTASSGNPGDGLVEFSRPGNSGRRGVAIRGNIVDPDDNTQMIETDLLYSYTNNSGTSDAINYLGKSDSGNNIVNYATMQKYIKDLGVNLDNYQQITYQPLKEDLEIVEGTWTGSAGDGNLKVESLEDESTHVGWMPNNTGKIYEGQPLKFVHDSGVRYGRVEAVWSNSNTTHLTVGDWAGDPFVAGEKTTVEYQLAPFVKKEGDTMSGNLTIKKVENGPASGGTQGQEAKLILNGDRNGTSNAVATVEFRSESSVASKTGYLAYYSGDVDAGKTIFTLNKPLESGGLYVNANNKGKTDGPGSHEYSFVVNTSGYGSFFVQGNNAYVRNDFYVGAYTENDDFTGAKKVATEEYVGNAVASAYGLPTVLQLGAYLYARTNDASNAGYIKSNTSTDPGQISQLIIHKQNNDGIVWPKPLLDGSIKEKMYISLYKTNSDYYQGQITGVTTATNTVTVTLNYVKSAGIFQLGQSVDVYIAYNKSEGVVARL